jgi:phosphatidylserine/phosphatidylglycerophosphate/cardiolipin synthase-like enzyme
LGPLDYAPYFSDAEALRRSGPSPDSSAMERALVSAIDNAQTSIDAALYDLERERLRDALLAAAGRGVRVRVVADFEHAEQDPEGATPYYAALRAAGIPVRASNFAGYLQHNKFAVFDGQRVWTGSANWTHTGMTYNLNNALYLRAPHLAIAYGREFAEMFEAGRFATRKLDDTPHVFAYDDATVEVRFSPSDGVEARVVDAVSRASEQISFAMFYWTSEELGKLVASRAMTDGLRVSGVWDAVGASNRSSQDERMCAAGIPVWIENFGGKVHHKFAVLDPEGEHPVTITGSYNWTGAGEEQNDENTLIIRDQRDIASAYQGEIDRLMAHLPESTICRRSSAESGLPACSDGIDNDFDDLIDLADPNCRESTVATCLDRIDNDADGFIDQEDIDCYLAPTPTPDPPASPEPSPTIAGGPSASPSPTTAGIPDPAETRPAPLAFLYLPFAGR